MAVKNLFKISCSKCFVFIGIFETKPVYALNGILNEKQPYKHSVFKYREDGMPYYDVHHFCSKKCEDEFIKAWKESRIDEEIINE